MKTVYDTDYKAYKFKRLLITICIIAAIVSAMVFLILLLGDSCSRVRNFLLTLRINGKLVIGPDGIPLIKGVGYAPSQWGNLLLVGDENFIADIIANMGIARYDFDVFEWVLAFLMLVIAWEVIIVSYWIFTRKVKIESDNDIKKYQSTFLAISIFAMTIMVIIIPLIVLK